MGKLPIFMSEMRGIGHRVSSEYLKSPCITWLSLSFRLSSVLVL